MLFILVQALLIVICFLLINQYVNDIYPDQVVQNHFEQADCLLLNKKLSIDGGYAQRYRADFLISYNADGVQYQRWVSGNGLDNAYYFNRNKQEKVLSRYQEGGLYSCWYSKEEPQHAIFILRHDWTSFFYLLLPGILGLIMAYMLSMKKQYRTN